MKRHEFSKVINKIAKIPSVEIKERSSGDLIYKIFYGQKLIMWTKVSHGGIKSGDIRNIAKQLHLRIDELMPYARCTIENEEYLNILKNRGVI